MAAVCKASWERRSEGEPEECLICNVRGGREAVGKEAIKERGVKKNGGNKRMREKERKTGGWKVKEVKERQWEQKEARQERGGGGEEGWVRAGKEQRGNKQ